MDEAVGMGMALWMGLLVGCKDAGECCLRIMADLGQESRNQIARLKIKIFPMMKGITVMPRIIDDFIIDDFIIFAWRDDRCGKSLRVLAARCGSFCFGCVCGVCCTGRARRRLRP